MYYSNYSIIVLLYCLNEFVLVPLINNVYDINAFIPEYEFINKDIV